MESAAAINEDFNLSTDQSTTVSELVELIWTKINSNSQINLVNDPGYEHDIAKRIPSTEKAKKILGFEAKTSLSEMLDIVIPWIKEAIAQQKI